MKSVLNNFELSEVYSPEPVVSHTYSHPFYDALEDKMDSNKKLNNTTKKGQYRTEQSKEPSVEEQPLDLFQLLSHDFEMYKTILKEDTEDFLIIDAKNVNLRHGAAVTTDIGTDTKEIHEQYIQETNDNQKQIKEQIETLYIQIETQKLELIDESSDIAQLRAKLLGSNQSARIISPSQEIPSLYLLYLKLPSKNFEAPFMHYDSTIFSVRKGSDLMTFNDYRFNKIFTNFNLGQLDEYFVSDYLKSSMRDYLVFLQGPQDTHKEELTSRMALNFILRTCHGIQNKNQVRIRIVSITSGNAKIVDIALSLSDWKHEVEKTLESMKSNKDVVELMQPDNSNQNDHPLPAEFLFIEIEQINSILEGYEITSKRANRIKYIAFVRCRKRYSTNKIGVIKSESQSFSFSQSPSGSNRSDTSLSSLSQCLQECSNLSTGRSFEWQLSQLNSRSRYMKRMVLATFEPIYGRIFHTENYLQEFAIM